MNSETGDLVKKKKCNYYNEVMKYLTELTEFCVLRC